MAKSAEKNSKEPKSISYVQLGLMAIFFILGVFSLLIYQNGASEKIILGTPEIINFVFAVALSTASIILAVTAISLGKASEKAMIDRSDESIKLQNEVFRLTNEALNRIQSSTGVTEKRIEDIISGRVGDISSKITGVLDDNGITIKNKMSLEKEIRESLMKEVAVSGTTDAEKEAQQEERRRRHEAQKEYEQYINSIIILLSNDKQLTTVKLGSGNYNGDGADLFDYVFKLEDKLYGICIIDSDPLYKDYVMNVLSNGDFVKKLMIEAGKGAYSNIFIICKESEYAGVLQEHIQLYNDSFSKKLTCLFGPSEEVTTRLIDQIKIA